MSDGLPPPLPEPPPPPPVAPPLPGPPLKDTVGTGVLRLLLLHFIQIPLTIVGEKI